MAERETDADVVDAHALMRRFGAVIISSDCRITTRWASEELLPPRAPSYHTLAKMRRMGMLRDAEYQPGETISRLRG